MCAQVGLSIGAGPDWAEPHKVLAALSLASCCLQGGHFPATSVPPDVLTRQEKRCGAEEETTPLCPCLQRTQPCPERWASQQSTTTTWGVHPPGLCRDERAHLIEESPGPRIVRQGLPGHVMGLGSSCRGAFGGGQRFHI